jgi:nitrate/nitrite transport system permease protein
MNNLSLKVKGAMLSITILFFALCLWHIATAPKAVPAPTATSSSSEYEALMGKGGSNDAEKSGFPTLAQMGETFYKQLSRPFYDNGPNDKGIGIQLAYSLGRVGLGFFLAMLVAIPF